MKKQAFFLLFLLAGTLSYGQPDTTIVLDELMFTGARINTPFPEASRNIQIIQQKEIRQIPIQSIPEILSYSPGVDIRQRGPAGVQSDIGIRGGTFEQTLILLNGMKLTDPQTGHHVMNIPVPLDMISQVEILKGPGARIYGQNAFAGAVNFITAIPQNRQVRFRGYGGSFGSYGGNFSLSLPVRSYRQLFSFSTDGSDGYRHNTDYRIYNGFYQSEWDALGGGFNIMAGYTSKKFGANGFYASPEYTEQYEEVSTGFSAVSFEKEVAKLTIRPRVYWRWNRDKYLFIRNKPSVYQNLHTTNTFSAEVNSSYRSNVGITGFGIEYRKELIAGDWVRGGEASKSNLNGFGRDNFGVFLDHRFTIGNRFDITPGIYAAWYSDFGWNAFPGVDAGYQIDDSWRVYANVGRSYRIPTFYEQYYSSPVEQGNPDLKSEQAMTYEIGMRFMKKGITLEANYFRRNATQLIDWVFNGNDSIWHAENHQNVIADGLELAADMDFGTFISSAFPIKHITVSYNFINQNMVNQENAVSRYVLENMRNQVVVAVRHRIIGRLHNSLMMRYIDRVENDPYFLMDDRLYYEAPNGTMNIFLEITNITDKQYTEIMTPMPGRWFRGGINVTFGF